MTKSLNPETTSHVERDINLLLNVKNKGKRSKSAKQELIQLYAPLIKKVAYTSYKHHQKKNSSNNYSIEDFYHEAIIGFLKSLDHFDSSYGVAIHGLARPYMEEQLNNFKFSINSKVKISKTLKKYLGKINQTAKSLHKKGKNFNPKCKNLKYRIKLFHTLL